MCGNDIPTPPFSTTPQVWPERARDTVFLRCSDLPPVEKFLVDERGGITTPSLVGTVLHEL